MAFGDHGLARDLALRAAGLLVLAIGALAGRGLYRMVQALPRHPVSAAEMAVAAIGFVGLSAGSALTSLGAHLFDEVMLSERWISRR